MNKHMSRDCGKVSDLILWTCGGATFFLLLVFTMRWKEWHGSFKKYPFFKKKTKKKHCVSMLHKLICLKVRILTCLAQVL